MRNRSLNIIKGFMICALGLSLVAPSAMAGSITVRLYTSQEKACSDILGNTTGKYKVSEVVYDDSEYSVQEYLYVGETANHCGVAKDNWITKPTGKSISKSWNVNKGQYTVARTTLYSYRKGNMKRKCHASATLSNVQ